MKNHVWRPLFVVLGLVAVLLVARVFVVPKDFGIQDRGYMYGFHRLGNEQEWQNFPAKYQSNASCNDCHEEEFAANQLARHKMIPCENCHGAALGHPENPEKLAIDRSRELCIRCHAGLFTPTSARSAIPGIDAAAHNPEMVCSECHNPHNPDLKGMKP
ncbi:MAG: cytochrome c family protein [uncultured bacterium]|nr:MAG: cytochrome c family protein [uncultured bacterium]